MTSTEKARAVLLAMRDEDPPYPDWRSRALCLSRFESYYRCSRDVGHRGPHRAYYQHNNTASPMPIVTWEE